MFDAPPGTWTLTVRAPISYDGPNRAVVTSFQLVFLAQNGREIESRQVTLPPEVALSQEGSGSV